MKINSSLIRSIILPRKKDAHKGSFGHVLIIAGSKNMPGAPVLCAYGSLRSGAGLVTVGVPEKIADIIAKKIRPEAMLLRLASSKEGSISNKSYPEILKCIKNKKITSIVIGPGLGQGKEIYSLLKKIINCTNLPVIIDADGLNLISRHGLGILKSAKAEVVVTPHPGEMSRLVNKKTRYIQENRALIAKNFANRYKILCVLKGNKTIISDGKLVYINTTGNSGMATGGSGDVLSGILGALIAQVKNNSTINAALAGVYIHGLAGDIAAKIKGKTGMIAGDIAEYLSVALKNTLRK